MDIRIINMDHFVLVWGILIIAGFTQSADVLTAYPCPRQCNCYQGKVDEEVVSVVCRLDYIHPTANFSVILTQITSILYIMCTSEDVVSHVRDNMFSALTSFMGLSIENCRISYMPENFLSGMQSLEQVEIKSTGTLEMASSVFHQVPKLTHITVTSSHVTKMPDLCLSSKLKYVNVTDNDLQSMESTGVICENKTVLSKLSTLILDKNSIFNISSGSLKTMPDLKDLRIADGNLVNLEAGALADVKKLAYLDITNNFISEVPVSLFDSNNDLKILGLGRNPLGSVQKDLFSTPVKLLVLTLDYSGLSDTIWDSLSTLHKLKDLQLQGNYITSLNRTVLRNLSSLQNLDLGNNSISDLSTQVFQHLLQLQFLHVDQNNLSVIRNGTFFGLQNLLSLDLHGNQISSIEKAAFTDLEALTELDLSYNDLGLVPDFKGLKMLKSLDLKSNKIKLLPSDCFKGLKNLEKLDLSRNRIGGTVMEKSLNVPSLKSLDLSFNKIWVVHKATFEGLKNLMTLSLQNNSLENISMVFQDLSKLTSLDLSSNMLSTKLMSGMFPKNIENLDLSYNNLKDITEYAFYSYQELQKLSLKGNKLSTLAINDLAIPIKRSKTMMVYISENPFRCDCNMIWLRKKVNEVSMDTGFPVVGDMYLLQCHSGYRIDAPIPLYTVQSDNMLCTYEKECTDNCFCCDFEPCDCMFVCPPGCSCYSSSDFMAMHFVQCSNRGLTELPSNIPALTTELSVDGNNISEIYSRSFVGLIYLRVIHLDHSGVTTLANFSFIGLSQLRVLYLNKNNIQSITDGVFARLWNLTELHLEYNKISYIDKSAFSSLTSISELYLDHNLLTTLPESALKLFWGLSKMTLAENQWTCDCNFMVEFLPVLTNKSVMVSDYNNLYCITEDLIRNVSIKDVKSEICTNITSDKVTVIRKPNRIQSSQSILIILAAIAASIVVATCVIVLSICLWRPRSPFFRCSCKCRSEKGNVGENDKLYDAFLAYSHRDDDYVTREFIPRLENELGYKLCVYYRDFPVGGTMEETIACNIDRSKRTILLVSKNFNDHEWKNSAFYNSFQTLFRRNNNLIIVLLEDPKGMNLQRNLNELVKSHSSTVVNYHDMCFWEKLRYMMNPPKQTIMRNNTPDIILNHSYSRQDEDGYETPISSSASQTETDKFSALERRSLESLNNIYEEIRSSKLSDISDV
ncbi:toll-like receptor Tollo [Saccostrea echinata]|uniref:toll-like receptor Tollo n=1 Tax=Saccostrea echinata TaxID=191078 RepID=UPI002A840C7C|nr:toll-like receptor Tollo [Saccostrea echinata]